MRIQPPENPYEDHLIALLDRGIPLDQRENEMTEVRADMMWRERCRQVEFKRMQGVRNERP